jgi:hypothetical protein
MNDRMPKLLLNPIECDCDKLLIIKFYSFVLNALFFFVYILLYKEELSTVVSSLLIRKNKGKAVIIGNYHELSWEKI